MVNCNLLELAPFWNFHNNVMCIVMANTFGTARYECLTNTEEMSGFLPWINGSVAIDLTVLLLSISAIISSNATNKFWLFPDSSHKYFYRCHSFCLRVR